MRQQAGGILFHEMVARKLANIQEKWVDIGRTLDIRQSQKMVHTDMKLTLPLAAPKVVQSPPPPKKNLTLERIRIAQILHQYRPEEQREEGLDMSHIKNVRRAIAQKIKQKVPAAEAVRPPRTKKRLTPSREPTLPIAWRYCPRIWQMDDMPRPLQFACDVGLADRLSPSLWTASDLDDSNDSLSDYYSCAGTKKFRMTETAGNIHPCSASPHGGKKPEDAYLKTGRGDSLTIMGDVETNPGLLTAFNGPCGEVMDLLDQLVAMNMTDFFRIKAEIPLRQGPDGSSQSLLPKATYWLKCTLCDIETITASAGWCLDHRETCPVFSATVFPSTETAKVHSVTSRGYTQEQAREKFSEGHQPTGRGERITTHGDVQTQPGPIYFRLATMERPTIPISRGLQENFIRHRLLASLQEVDAELQTFRDTSLPMSWLRTLPPMSSPNVGKF
jgi:hypothetical protein